MKPNCNCAIRSPPWAAGRSFGNSSALTRRALATTSSMPLYRLSARAGAHASSASRAARAATAAVRENLFMPLLSHEFAVAPDDGELDEVAPDVVRIEGDEIAAEVVVADAVERGHQLFARQALAGAVDSFHQHA